MVRTGVPFFAKAKSLNHLIIQVILRQRKRAMLKFFRKQFRINSLGEGNLKKYFLYAFGEIVLIVISILLAWKINDLNEIRKNKIIELKIYDSLYEELELNMKSLNGAIEQYASDIVRLEAILNYVGQSPEQITQGAKDTIVHITYSELNILDGALNSVINTTKFEMIESTSLKRLITNYPTEIGVLDTEDAKVKKIVVDDVQTVIEKYLSLADMLPKGKTEYSAVKKFGAKSDYHQLLQDKKYQNSIVAWLLHTENLLSLTKKLRSRTNDISVKLSRELGYDLDG